jgi:hypothetical protein
MRAIIDDANERIADMRRRFEIEDTERRLGTPSPTANAPTTTAPNGTGIAGTAPSPTLTLADVFRDYASESLPLFTQQIALQTRIADATETTAVATTESASHLREIARVIASGTLVATIDEALIARQEQANLARGGRVAL